jgi:magnesium-transporting ATPase (P-type)
MEFRYALLSGAEFGNKETEIAKSVKARQAEVEARKAGNYVPPPTKLWTQVVKPLTARGTAEERLDCCTRSCFSPCWNHPRSGAMERDEKPFENANVFTTAERDTLLGALYGPCPPGVDAELNKKRKLALRNYCLHMALSNTVKPFDEVEVHPVTKEKQTVLKFQAEAAEELAMVQWARSVGFLKKTEAKPAILEITEYDEKLQPKAKKVEERYGLQAVLGFTSARARVTVIYQRESDGMIVVMTKGQDTVVLPLLHECPGREALLIDLNTLCTNGLRTLVNGHSELPAAWWNGKRDGKSNTRQEEFARIKDLAETPFSAGHTDGKCNKEKCEKCATHNFFNELETDAKLEYLGCMGLEDQLQLLVPETIRDFLRAGVKVWMITGDKLETAKNIGLACNLIDPDMPPQLKKGSTMKEASDAFAQSRLIEVTGQWAELGDNENELGQLFDCFDQNENGQLDKKELTQCLEALKFGVEVSKFDSLFKEFDHDNDGHISKPEFIKLMTSVKMSMYDAVKADIDDGFARYNEIKDHEAYPISVLVSRSAFEVMFPGKPVPGAPVKGKVIPEEELEKLRQKFFHLARHAKSVVFARAQPAMKKKMVTEIQRIDPMAVTLAVGDGANDTDMITAAHIGVGISGVEGTAATNSADYAIGTFRMLHTLLFVHGFWSYQRITTLVYFIFYKASLVAITQYFFGFFSGFAGQQFWNDLPYQFYNVVFTATPIMACAVLNKHLPRSTLENNPAAYREAKNKAFTSIGFLGWIMRSVIHSIILFFIPLGTIGYNNISYSGDPGHGLWYFSTSVYFCVVMVPTFLIVFEMVCHLFHFHMFSSYVYVLI